MLPEFIATLSDDMRLVVSPQGQAFHKVQELAKQALEIVLTAEGVAESIKKETIPGVAHALRQVDMKDDNNKIIIKTFTGWNSNLNCWHVYIEFPFETFWEDKNRPIGEG